MKKGDLLKYLGVGFLFLFPLLFLGILKFLYKYLPGEEIGNPGDWINFGGLYFGAVIAVSGIAWQIKRAEIHREEDVKREKENKKKGAINFLVIHNEVLIENLKKTKIDLPRCCFSEIEKKDKNWLKEEKVNNFTLDFTFKVIDEDFGKDIYNVFIKIENLENLIKEIYESFVVKKLLDKINDDLTVEHKSINKYYLNKLILRSIHEQDEKKIKKNFDNYIEGIGNFKKMKENSIHGENPKENDYYEREIEIEQIEDFENIIRNFKKLYIPDEEDYENTRISTFDLTIKYIGDVNTRLKEALKNFEGETK